jgi:hypothetical protein
MGFAITSKGNWQKTFDWFKKARNPKYQNALRRYAIMGLVALENATPVDTGLTAKSWDYEIIQNRRYSKIVYTNSNVVAGTPIAILLQYGHGTGSGGWVEGRDYINPAVRATFDNIANDAWRELIQ